MNHKLSGHFSEFGAIVPRWILQHVEVNHARSKGTIAVLHVADLIDDKKRIDKIAADSEAVTRSGRISVGDQELVVTCDECRMLFIPENFEAVDPVTGFFACGFVVDVGRDLQRAHGVKIWKGKLLHGRRELCRKMLRMQGEQSMLGDPDSDLSR